MSSCILWSGATNGFGYGRHSGTINGVKQPLAHVVAWEKLNGPKPDGMELHHRCETRLCINPAHLDLIAKAAHTALHNPKRSHCIAGHPLVGNNRMPNGRTPTGTVKYACRACKRIRRSGLHTNQGSRRHD